MDYTQSPNNVVDAGTGFRRHEDNQALPTVLSEKDINSLIWVLMEVNKAAGIVATGFDETVPATYKDVVQAIKRLAGANVTTVTFALSPFLLTPDHAGLVIINASAGAVVLTLPAANVLTAVPLEYLFYRNDASANAATVNKSAIAANVDTIDGAPSFTVTGQYSSRGIRSDAVNNWAATPLFILPPTISGTAKNFRANAIGINNYNTVITADEFVLKNAAGLSRVEINVNKTVNANGVVGAPLSVMSARAASTFYYAWLWYNAAQGLTATLDTSSTAPTPPTGYIAGDYKALTPHSVPTDSSGSTYLRQVKTIGLKSQYVVLAGSNTAVMPIVISGVQGSITVPTWAAASLVGTVSANAVAVTAVYSFNSGTHIVAPNNQFGAYNSTTNQPPFANESGVNFSTSFTWLLESMNLYVASNVAACKLQILGWEVPQ